MEIPNNVSLFIDRPKPNDRFMRTRMMSYVLVCTQVFLGVPPSLAQAIDTTRWVVKTDSTWDFFVSLPPGWVILNMPMGGLRLAIVDRQNPAGAGGNSMCQVHVNPQPETVGMQQGPLNDYIVSKGPPPPQEVSEASGRAGTPYEVYSTALEWVNGRPAYIYDGLMTVRSAANQTEQRILSETIYVPGRTYAANCSVASGSVSASKSKFEEQLPLFRGFLQSFGILVPVVN